MSFATLLYVYGLLLIYGCYVTIKTLKSVHMLQQNSYRNERYVKWMKAHPKHVYMKRDLLPLLSIFLFLMGNKLYAILSFVVFFILLTVTQERKPAKKPLVITARVQRLFVIIALLYLMIYAGTFFIFGTAKDTSPFVVLILTFAAFLNFLVVWLANTIISPFERKINQGYMNDARRIVDEMKGMQVIGVTGSYGKTSVKHILHTVLSSKFHTLMTPESYNTPMGVTITVRNHLKPIHEVFIAEMGAKQIGDIQEICDIVHPNYAIITAIGPQHLETFGSLENVQKTKFEIVECLPESGVAFLNIDDQNIATYPIQNTCKIVTYGIENPEAKIRATEVIYNEKGSNFFVEVQGEQVQFQTNLLGKHNIYNVLCAIAVGLEMGLSLKKMASAVQKVQPVAHRLALKKVNADLTIIDDAFNANPVGAQMALEVLYAMPGKKIMITPGMIELGEKQYECNKAFGSQAAKVCDHVILVGRRQTIPIRDGLQEVGYPKDKYTIVSNLNDAFKVANRIMKTGEHYFILLENDLPDAFNEK
ncbi:MAG TPA: UDP-N-acetylmuramoyl-tripeptide--D-alanyl-D-alanine ligase [Firmicutes bacterium]|nr:UDP-N-acetylmuramoyl-tripeptide--D-alanyl-D-alanine ligase [Bacillota bacterium]